MYTPTLDQVKALGAQGNLVPIYRELPADLETPVSAFLKVAQGKYSFLLESVEGGERLARYSFIGTQPYKVIKTGPGQRSGAVDPLLLIEQELSRFRPVAVAGLPRFLGGAVGYLAYEVTRYYEPRIPLPAADPLGVPEAIFLFTDTLLVFDHLKHVIKVISHVHLDGEVDKAYAEATERIERLARRLLKPLRLAARAPLAEAAPPVTSNLTKDAYLAMVERCKQYIVAGDIIQVVPSQRLARPTQAHPFDIYRALRAINPSPYMYFLELDGFHIVGASPECLVRVEDGIIYNFPLAGTRRRGATPAEDEALAQELRADEKERAEHIMLVDLGRNDVGRVSEPGSVRVADLMRIVRYSHVMHLESEVRGTLRKDRTMFDALRSCLPAGTLSGAPKIRAMEIIAELEPARRGPYGAAIGYFGFDGNMDTAIPIRTIVLKDAVAYVQAGGGIVYDSVPELEFQESMSKAMAPLRAIEQAEQVALGARGVR
ncbi:MAG: anthranilate synthase component I [Dehalococcoidia bacterium]|nr:anthranilate synthase component I [Dehalococcoidia bacterium]